MKKRISYWLPVSLIVCVAVIACIPFSAAATNVPIQAYTIHEAYDYPIVPGTDEWEEFSKLDEMIAATQIPEDILESMDTQALVDTILQYPLLSTFRVFNTVSEGFDAIAERCNGIPELLSRPDAVDVVYAKYKDFPIAQYFEGTGEIGYNAVFRQPFLEALLYEAISTCKQDLPESKIANIENTVMQKQAEKDSSGRYRKTDKVYIQMKIQDMVTPAVSVTNVRTPKGTLVPVYIRGEELSAAEKQQTNADMAYLFPNAVRIGEPTTNYNCHSYAWYSATTSNRYWMNDPSAYMQDGSYTKRNGSAGLVNRNKAYYRNGVHSAVVVATYPITVNSKWGEAGLYRHAVDYGPYSGPFTYWY